MKKYVLLIGILMMSYIATSQDLVPKVLLIKNKKHFCFTIEQSRALAKLLELGAYNDSLVSRLGTLNHRLQLLSTNKDSIVDFQQYQLRNYSSIMDNKDQKISMIDKAMKRKDRKIKHSKFHKMFLGSGLLIITILLISK